MSLLFNTGVQMFKSESVYAPEWAFSKCLCNSPTNILLPERSRKFDTTEQHKRLWCTTRPDPARALLLRSQMHIWISISSFAAIREVSLEENQHVIYVIFNEIAEAKHKTYYDILSRMNGRMLAMLSTASHEMAIEEMRRAGSQINKSSSQIIRLRMCRPVSGFAGWWPEAETDSADNLCRTCVCFTQVNVT